MAYHDSQFWFMSDSLGRAQVPQECDKAAKSLPCQIFFDKRNRKVHTPRLILFQLSGTTAMPGIRVKENEPFEVAIRRFKRAIEKTGLLTELRAREFYEKPTAERKRKLAAAVKRHHKRVRSQTLPPKLY